MLRAQSTVVPNISLVTVAFISVSAFFIGHRSIRSINIDTMSSAQYLPTALSSIASRVAFIDAQRGIGLDMSAVQGTQATALELQFSTMEGISVGDAASIITALNAGQ